MFVNEDNTTTTVWQRVLDWLIDWLSDCLSDDWLIDWFIVIKPRNKRTCSEHRDNDNETDSTKTRENK